jgi:hypothetical protein
MPQLQKSVKRIRKAKTFSADFPASLLGFSERPCADHLPIYAGGLTREIALGLGLAYLGEVIAYRHGSAPTDLYF